MENLSEVSEDTTFNSLKYKRYASVNIKVGDRYVPADSTYWVNDEGLLHKENGPAVERSDGYKEWCINGEHIIV